MPVRPDLEAELLLALGRRDASTSQRLVQQLVHRRGVGSLERLRSRSLAIEPDQQGWIWLSQLVAADPIAGTLLPSVRVPDAVASRQSLVGPASAALPPRDLTNTAAACETAAAFETAAVGEDADRRGSALASASALGLRPALASPDEMVLAADVCPAVAPGTAVELETAVGLGMAGELGRSVELGTGVEGSETLSLVQGLAGLESLDGQAQSMAPEPTIAPVASAALAPVAGGQGLETCVDLSLRAETAVDVAFEALAAEFPGYGRLEIAEPGQAGLGTVEPGRMERGAQVERVQSEPVPLELVHPDQQALPADLSSPSRFDRSSPALDQRPRRRFSFVIPQPLDQEPVGADATTASGRDGSWQEQGAGDSGQEHGVLALGDDPSLVDQAAHLWSRAEGRMGRLRDRLRRRLSLARLKGVVQDCVEEAVSGFQGSQPAAETWPQEAQDQWLGAGVVLAAADPWPQEQPLAAAVGGFGSPQVGHQAPVAAFGPPLGGESSAPTPVVVEPPARLSPTQQVRQHLLGGQKGDARPAPAPQALSDLRAWLAADDDLPRAS